MMNVQEQAEHITPDIVDTCTVCCLEKPLKYRGLGNAVCYPCYDLWRFRLQSAYCWECLRLWLDGHVPATCPVHLPLTTLP